MTMFNTSRLSTACHARRLRRRRPCASSTSISPMITSALRVTLVSVPGTKALTLCSLACQAGLKIARTSDNPITRQSNEAMPGPTPGAYRP